VERRLHYNIFQSAFQDSSLGAPLTATHRVISCTYDAVGNRLSLTMGGDVVDWEYDDANRLVLSEVEGLTSVNGQVTPGATTAILRQAQDRPAR